MRTLSQIADDADASVGGKAFQLAVLRTKGLPVPDGIVLQNLPQTQEQWDEVMTWWRECDHPRLAARSSAQGEDSGSFSFAGQLTSVLDIKREDELKNGIETCFASFDRAANRAYQEHFQNKLAGMNVLVQRMIEPLFSGVYFSLDPRGTNETWLIEAVNGIGEKLVSGHTTPFQFSKEKAPETPPANWQEGYLTDILFYGNLIEKELGYAVDVEWAIDKEGRFWVLQARPITTLHARSTGRDENEIIEKEMRRLNKTHKPSTTFDGQTFSEWTGLPSMLAFHIWEIAFSKRGAFPKALHELGYIGETADTNLNESVLERVFGRAYLNLDRLEPLFFGKIPYEIVPEPSPHLEFSWHKIDGETILHAPSAVFHMLKVAWVLQSRHDQLLEKCRNELNKLKLSSAEASWKPDQYANIDLDALLAAFRTEVEDFATLSLKWPFVLAVVAESGLESLRAAVDKDVGNVEGKLLTQRWMRTDLSTVTREMDHAYEEASINIFNRAPFLNKYGHRGPGELDLKNARWIELGEQAFQNSMSSATPLPQKPHLSHADEIHAKIHPLRRAYVESQWRFLKSLLELREEWKMEIMKPYARLRWMAVEIGKQTGWGNDIFWLRVDEILENRRGPTVNPELLNTLRARKKQTKVFHKISLPGTFSLRQLKTFLASRDIPTTGGVLSGESLSPGIGYGEVRIIHDPTTAQVENWPKNVILVAEATDPGWTPLFQRASGIVIERGGVLSHCAIVAREMGIPAVSKILGSTIRLKDGDHVWVDGNLGRVTISASATTAN